MHFFSSLSSSDWILFFTLLAVIWYSYETRRLRKWQKLQVLLTIFFKQTDDWDSGMKSRTRFPEQLQCIIRDGKYDPRWAYSPARRIAYSKFEQFLNFWEKVESKFKK